MSTKSVKLNVEVTDNGSADRLNKKMSQIKDTADGISKKTAAASRAAGGSRAAAREEEGMYDQARAGRGTGAAARDFAQQAQGLGGLVRLYATFAANAFAASAAFTALSRAMDTTNMVRGLNELGAASGKNLGNLSKQVVEATGNAVSLREAMEATVKASSAGMSSKDIIRLSESAAKASQALGVDMTDALSRLSRGIVKLEPELLDELGLFTKIDGAVEQYARTVGKSASSLSDFERRQAFANAVLAEAEQKFGNIKVDANPYNQLLASLKDLTQSGLELVNTVLAPIVKLLASSPVALGASIAGIAAILLKQAIPALGHWRESLAASAEEASKTARESLAAFDDRYQTTLQRAFRLPELEKDVKKAEKALDEAKKRLGGATASAVIPETGLKRIDTLTTEQGKLDAINKQIKARSDIVKEIEANERRGNLALQQATIARLQAAKDELETRKNIATVAQLEANLAKAKAIAEREGQKIETIANRPQGRLDPQRIEAEATRKAIIESEKLRTAQALSETARTAGLRVAFQQYGAEVEKTNALLKASGLQAVGTFDKITGAVKAGGAAVTSRAMQIAGAFSDVAMVAGVAVLAFQVVNTVFSENSKQLAEVGKAFDTLNSNTEAVTRTFDRLSKLDPLQKLSVASVQAAANSLDELSQSAANLVDKISEADKNAGGWDRFIDSIKSGFGQGLSDDLAKGVSTSIAKAIELADEGPAKEEFLRKIREITNLDPKTITIDRSVLRNFISSAGSPEEQLKAAKLLVTENQKLTASQKLNADYAKSFKDSLDETVKKSEDLNKSLSSSSPLLSLAENFSKMSIELGKSENSVTTILELSNNQKALALFNKEDADMIKAAKKDIETITALQKGVEQATAESNKEWQRFAAIQESITDNLAEEVAAQRTADANAAFEAAKKADSEINRVRGLIEELQKKVSGTASKAASAAAIKAIEQIELSFAESLSKAGASYKLAILSERSSENTNTAIERIRVEKSQLGETIRNTKALFDLTLQLKQNATQDIASGKTTATPQEQVVALASQPILKLISSGNIQAAADALKNASDEVRASLTPTLIQASGTLSKLTELGSQMRTLNFKETVEVYAKGFVDAQKFAEAQVRIAESKKKELELQNSLSAISEEEYTRANLRLNTESASNALAVQSLNIAREISKSNQELAQLEAKESSGRKLNSQEIETKNNIIAANNRLIAQIKVLYDNELTETQIRNLKAELALIDIKYKKLSERLALENKLNDISTKTSDLVLETASSELEILKNTGKISEEEYSRQKDLFNISKIRYDLNKELLNNAKDLAQEESKYKKQLDELNAAVEARGDLGPSDEQITKYTELFEALSSLKTVYSGLDQASRNLAKTRELDILKLAEYNEQLREQQSIVDSLAVVFGSFGEGLGKFITSLDASSKRLGELAKKEEFLKQARKEGMSDPGDEKALNKIGQERLGIYAKEINSVKGLFKEKTAAYKILGGIEKAMHIAKLAQMTAETVAAISSSATKVGASMAEAGANGIAAITAALKAPFPVGFVAGAAMAAIVASLIPGFNKRVSRPAGATAEEQQKVQGTGQDFINGQLTNTGNGILGDSTAKSEDIAKSLDLMQKYQFKELDYSNDAVKALKEIENNTRNLAGILVRIPGLQSGSAFGTKEMSDPGKLFGLFGSKSTQILDAGIKVVGQLSDILSGSVNATQYETVESKKSSLFGLIRSTRTSTNTAQLDAVASGAIADLFKSTQSALVATVAQFGKIFGASIESVQDQINNATVNFQISTKGLTGTEIAEAIQAEVGIAMNGIIRGAIPAIESFQQVGEGLLTTLTRVATEVNVVNKSFELAGISFEEQIKALGLTAKDSILKYQEILKETGGLDEFADQVSFFTDTFLTEAQKLEPIRKSVNKALTDLTPALQTVVPGFQDIVSGSIDTKEEFANLVRGFDFTKDGATKTFASLMGLVEAFAMITPELKEVADEAKRNAQLNQQNVQILRAQGRAQESLALQRKLELDNMPEYLRAGQELIWLLDDRARIEKSWAKQDIEILNLLGRSSEALRLSRQTELESLEPALRANQQRIWMLQDEAKALQTLSSIQQSVLNAQGKTSEATALGRQQQLKSLPEEFRAAQEEAWRLEDAAKIATEAGKLQIRSLELQGKATEALTLVREEELKVTDPALKKLKQALWDLEDATKAMGQRDSLNERMLQAQGKSAESLTIARNKELEATDPLVRELLRATYVLEDAAKAREQATDLEIRMNELLGKSYEVVRLQRQRELEQLEGGGAAQEIIDATKALWNLEDALAKNTAIFNIEQQVLEATGKSVEALNRSRERELETLEESIRPIQQLAWQIQDLTSELDGYRNQEIEILKLLGKDSEALTLERERELSALSGTARVAQEYIFKLQDEVKTKEILVSIGDQLKSSSIKLLEAKKVFSELGTEASSTITKLGGALAQMLAESKRLGPGGIQGALNTATSNLANTQRNLSLVSFRTSLPASLSRANKDVLVAAQKLSWAQDDLANSMQGAASASNSLSAATAELKSAQQALAEYPNEVRDRLLQGRKDLEDYYKTLVDSVRSAYEEQKQIVDSFANSIKDSFDKIKGIVEQATQERKTIEENFSNYYKALTDRKAELEEKLYGKTTQSLEDAAKAARDFSKSLSEYINKLRGQTLSSGSNRLEFNRGLFAETLAKARAGDTDARSNITGIADQLLSSSQDSAKSFAEYQRDSMMVLEELSKLRGESDALGGADATNDDLLSELQGINAKLETAIKSGLPIKAENSALEFDVDSAVRSYRELDSVIKSANDILRNIPGSTLNELGLGLGTAGAGAAKLSEDLSSASGLLTSSLNNYSAANASLTTIKQSLESIGLSIGGTSSLTSVDLTNFNKAIDGIKAIAGQANELGISLTSGSTVSFKEKDLAEFVQAIRSAKEELDILKSEGLVPTDVSTGPNGVASKLETLRDNVNSAAGAVAVANTNLSFFAISANTAKNSIDELERQITGGDDNKTVADVLDGIAEELDSSSDDVPEGLANLRSAIDTKTAELTTSMDSFRAAIDSAGTPISELTATAVAALQTAYSTYNSAVTTAGTTLATTNTNIAEAVGIAVSTAASEVASAYAVYNVAVINAANALGSLQADIEARASVQSLNAANDNPNFVSDFILNRLVPNGVALTEGTDAWNTALTQLRADASTHRITSRVMDEIMGWAPGTSLAAVTRLGLPSFNVGTDYVPEDMVAQIHKGEAVVPAEANRNWAQANQDMANAIQSLNDTVTQLKDEQRAIGQSLASSNNEIAKILRRVTPDGDALATRAAT